jgi:hypothetical protein
MDLDAGYVLRIRDEMPKQGNHFPWKIYQNYIKVYFSMRVMKLDKH